MSGGFYAPPFSTGWLLVWDSLRALVIVGGLGVVVAAIALIRHTTLSSRMALTVALLCFTTSAVGTEIEHLGDHATYRLFFNLVGVLAAGGGLWLARREI